MSSTILALSNLLRGLASLLILGLLGVGGWVIYEAHHMQALLNRELQETTAELSKHKAQVEHLTNENQRIALALRLLTIDHRVAEIEVLNQREGQKHLTTTFRFIELTKDGHPIGEVKEFTVEGDTIYIDALVIKHADSLIDKGDPLRSTSVCLFRRVFGEYQEPSKGFPLDPWSSRPAVYSQGNEI